MSGEQSQFLMGAMIMAILLMVAFLLEYTKGLSICAKQHNVYACEYVAVPKKGE